MAGCTSERRDMPIHPALLAEDFLSFVPAINPCHADTFLAALRADYLVDRMRLACCSVSVVEENPARR